MIPAAGKRTENAFGFDVRRNPEAANARFPIFLEA